MKIRACAVGRTSTGYIKTGIDEYISRLKHFIPFETIVVADIKNNRNLSESQQKSLEGEAILQQVKPGDCLILLDERGREFSSRQFAQFVEQRMSSISRNIIFVIGGPYGFSDEVYRRADEKISLSRMTFSHEMVRLFFVEQLYRAMTILRGLPYHHD